MSSYFQRAIDWLSFVPPTATRTQLTPPASSPSTPSRSPLPPSFTAPTYSYSPYD